jgi:hypothetical protein
VSIEGKGSKAERAALKAARHAEKLKRRPAGDERADRERLAAAFEREERTGANEESRRLLAADPPMLDDIQRDLVAHLAADGIAQVHFSELFSEELWQGLAASAAVFTHEVESRLAGETAQGKGARIAKRGEGGFIQRRYERGAQIDPADAWLQAGLSSRLLGIVNSYLGLWAKLTYYDQWYTVPMPDGAERSASQNWHRDHNDRHLVKVFVYLDDVDAGAGPFEYVPGSTSNGRYADLWPWAPSSDHYPPKAEFDEQVPSSAVRTLTGPAGTMILCDTSGFHRGGFATERPRVLWRYNFVSPAALVLTKRRFTVDHAHMRADLSPAARFALV